MIDLDVENVFPIGELPSHIPSRHGRPINVATAYRWAKGGCRGVRLETILIGGIRYTSTEALRRFSDRLSGETGPTLAPTPVVVTAAARRADEALSKLGI